MNHRLLSKHRDIRDKIYHQISQAKPQPQPQHDKPKSAPHPAPQAKTQAQPKPQPKPKPQPQSRPAPRPVSHSNNNNDITIIVPTHNNEDLIDKCLRSLMNQVNLNGVSVYIIDDKSTDKTVELAKVVMNEFKDKIYCVQRDNKTLFHTIIDTLRNINSKFVAFVKCQYINHDYVETLRKGSDCDAVILAQRDDAQQESQSNDQLKTESISDQEQQHSDNHTESEANTQHPKLILKREIEYFDESVESIVTKLHNELEEITKSQMNPDSADITQAQQRELSSSINMDHELHIGKFVLDENGESWRFINYIYDNIYQNKGETLKMFRRDLLKIVFDSKITDEAYFNKGMAISSICTNAKSVYTLDRITSI